MLSQIGELIKSGNPKIIRELGGKGFCFVSFEGLKNSQIDDCLNSMS